MTRRTIKRSRLLAPIAAALLVAGAVVACTPGTSPSPSIQIPSVTLPAESPSSSPEMESESPSDSASPSM